MDLVVVRRGSYGSGERRSLSREVERGRFVRVRPGVHIETADWETLNESARHLVAMRALVAVSDRPVVFSHWSAAVVHQLPLLGDRLGRVHVTVPGAVERGTRTGVAAHVFDVREPEVRRFGDLLVTGPARTVVDIAGAAPFDHGVVTADGALRAHLPRALLEQAVQLAGPRRSGALIDRVVAFAHPGGESAAESESRVTMFRHGIEPPELQRRFFDRQGFVARTDTWFDRVRGVGEVDGRQKYLDPRYAPSGAGVVVHEEKRREDRLRALAEGLVRWGYAEGRSARLLLPILAVLGVVPLVRRPTLEDWARIARAARPTPLPDPGRALGRG